MLTAALSGHGVGTGACVMTGAQHTLMVKAQARPVIAFVEDAMHGGALTLAWLDRHDRALERADVVMHAACDVMLGYVDTAQDLIGAVEDALAGVS